MIKIGDAVNINTHNLMLYGHVVDICNKFNYYNIRIKGEHHSRVYRFDFSKITPYTNPSIHINALSII